MKKIVIYCGLFSFILFASSCQSRQVPSTMSQTTPTTSTNQETTVPSVSTISGQQSSHSFMDATKEIKVSVKKAIDLFLAAYPNVKITKLELDSSWGISAYEIEGVDDQKEYEAKINAENAKMQTQPPKQLDYDEQNGQKKKEDALDISNLLSIEEATSIAIKQVGGGTVTDWKLSKELGITYWEVKVKNGYQTIQVKLNSQTGKVLATEVDD
ncbi:PepSY domain-containing protein [Enterococcus ratti]|uniref:PepSY domain-containing protein n=1 Tax=Enterococcus ratti TaxID=150033 RepID=UPI003514EFAA